ncbi:MAG: glycogen synthase GlgA [Hyphomicrobiales bacterium]|nr:glycogen synthase GlgA [Hyphomicrobiales bacterium]MBV9517919.1 glycogen synthase GlgA [Hyphomicrobiales bacterium]
MESMKVLAVTSEIYPLVKTGGLADVAGALPIALAREAVRVRTLVPGYPAVLGALEKTRPLHAYEDLQGGPARLLEARAGKLELFVIDAPHLYRREGNPYVDSEGKDWDDNALRFGALAKVGAEIASGLVQGYQPKLVHAHDWQAGLAPAYLRGGPATVITVHNLAFQGLFSSTLADALELPPEIMTLEGVEFHGRIGFLKAGLYFADAITTVSPTYAAEICTPEGGMGLDGLLRARARVLTGICNGIDTNVWSPRKDPHITARFAVEELDLKAANKAALREKLQLAARPDAPLFGVISRLTEQKGIDLIAAVLPDLAKRGVQFAMLGSGDPSLEDKLREAASRHRGSIALFVGYDEALAHMIQAGSDALLVPSRFEPCGLTQLAALRYGTLPIVSRVGGLADTVIDANEAALAAGVATGFQFTPVSEASFRRTLDRALTLWQNKKTWRRLQQNAMRSRVGWGPAAKLYASLFRAVTRRVADRRAGAGTQAAKGASARRAAPRESASTIGQKTSTT